MSGVPSSDAASSIAGLEQALSELFQAPAAADIIAPAPSAVPLPDVQTVTLADDGATSISLHQKPNCCTSTFRYFGETEDDLPHGVGIRIYTNSGSTEKGEFFRGIFERLGEFTCTDYVHRGSFVGGVAHGPGVRQWFHFPTSHDLPGITLSRRYQMNGATPFETEQIGEFRFGTFFSPASIPNQFFLEVELAIRSGISVADPTNVAKQAAKLFALDRESENRRKCEAESEILRLEQEALAQEVQLSATEETSRSCVIS